VTTIPVVPPEAGPDRALDPPPPDPRPPAEPLPAAVAEGDVTVAEDVLQAAPRRITADIGTATMTHRFALSASNRITTRRRSCLAMVQRVADVHLRLVCAACDGTVTATAPHPSNASAPQPPALRPHTGVSRALAPGRSPLRRIGAVPCSRSPFRHSAADCRRKLLDLNRLDEIVASAKAGSQRPRCRIGGAGHHDWSRRAHSRTCIDVKL